MSSGLGIPAYSRRLLESAVIFLPDGCTIRVQMFFPSPSIPTLFFRSTRDQHGERDPILVTVRLYRMVQLNVFGSRPFTLAPTRPADAGSQGIMPSTLTLISRSTRNPSANCDPILATMRLYRILQLAVFVFCPFTLASSR
jgi:hypothetical protein